jgi:hypothetical protein
MEDTKTRQLVPYETIPPGVEALYTDEDPSTVPSLPDPDPLPAYCQLVRFVDQGRVCEKWSTWNLPSPHKEGTDWEDNDINFINNMQRKLGHLDDKVRQIRAHIGHLVPCDNGVPVTIDELLSAIGKGELEIPSFHNGCCAAGRWWDSNGTQPHQVESMGAIDEVLTGYLEGRSKDELRTVHPELGGFIDRTFQWFGNRSGFTELQRLMLERVLLLIEVCSRVEKKHETAYKDLFEEGGTGEKIDTQIADIAGLPKIYPEYRPEFRQNLDTIDDPGKKELYTICGAIAHGFHTVSDCHHSTFRWLENWLYAIGTGKWGIPTRRVGAEKERVGRLLFGYVLGLDRWLAGKPMQFVLMDLGHIDLGFDPRNEILRVYAYLGEDRTPVKTWLAASLWWSLMNNRPAGLARQHKELIELAASKEINLREWMDSSGSPHL